MKERKSEKAKERIPNPVRSVLSPRSSSLPKVRSVAVVKISFRDSAVLRFTIFKIDDNGRRKKSFKKGKENKRGVFT